MRTYNKTTVRNCSARMIEAGATNATLAEAAGVSAQTVQKARKGLEICVAEAGFIDEALSTRTFQRAAKGPRGRVWV